jgi:hypothetical protein
MLLRDLHALAQQGAKHPFEFWHEAFAQSRDKILHDLQALETRLPAGTRTFILIHSLVFVFTEEQPEEWELAEAFAGIAQVFFHQTPQGHQELIEIFTKETQAFLQEARVRHLFAKQRGTLKERLSPEEQKAFDHRLFAKDGMMFCLEFYLSLYKSIQDTTTQEQRQSFIDCPTVNLGYGGVPGLRADILSNEPLEKFFFLILDDCMRLRLWRAFFDLRDVLARSASYEEIMSDFRLFLQTLMQAYLDMDIDRLTSDLVVPYGHRPLISSIKL